MLRPDCIKSKTIFPMPNTYTQLYVQIVYAVKGRANLIPKKHKEELHKYTTGIIQNRDHKLLAVHAMPDHVHIFVGLHPAQSISDMGMTTWCPYKE